MDYQTIAIAAGVVAASAGSLAILWRMAERAPLGYEDERGFHYGDALPPVITVPAGCEFPAPRAAPAAANSNVPKLTRDQRAVLLEMRDHLGFPAAFIAELTGLPLRRVRAAQRSLRDKGLAELGPLFDDENRLCGRGYWLTEAGEQERVNRARHAGLAA